MYLVSGFVLDIKTKLRMMMSDKTDTVIIINASSFYGGTFHVFPILVILPLCHCHAFQLSICHCADDRNNNRK